MSQPSVFSHSSVTGKYIEVTYFSGGSVGLTQQPECSEIFRREKTMLAVEERIQMLRDRFAESLPERVVQLRRTWMRLCASPANGEIQQEFERLLHTLGGTAGTYGLNHIAGLAVEGELTCSELDGEPESETLLYLGSIIEDIGHAVESWLTGPPLESRVAREETAAVEVAHT